MTHRDTEYLASALNLAQAVLLALTLTTLFVFGVTKIAHKAAAEIELIERGM